MTRRAAQHPVGAAADYVHPDGTGPMRLSAIAPDVPALLPPVKLKFNVALEQLWNASVAVPTGTLCGAVAVESNTPPVVS